MAPGCLAKRPVVVIVGLSDPSPPSRLKTRNHSSVMWANSENAAPLVDAVSCGQCETATAGIFASEP
ncbi:hypothetical protein N7537_010353 [Penicillium hordei]|uniref:Uncharacterized protein n=1 Tax=Penicillium hordei TaxID=40994 RepID=A0AAD6DUI7_9EURO|nr:uncharacterized protein N7537_010353 [Penicillium hordei]KAJ5593449.1 hypothetical protein N7537_010353 [Penicillium hordei]